MRGLWSQRTFIAGLIVVAGGTLALDALGGEVERPASDITAAPGSFQSRSAFCPPSFSRRLGSQTVAIASDPGEAATIRIQPQQQENSELPEGRLLMQRVTGPAVSLVGYGSLLHGTALLSTEKPVVGADAARCPRVVSENWYFPAGSSSLGYDERILVRNPFPDEAVVNVSFYTPTGRTTKANLAEVPVSAGETEFIAVNDYLRQQPVLGVSVHAERGRVVAWRAMFAESEDRPDGVIYGLGSTSATTEWYFPEGAVGQGLEEVITLLNPNKREAIVTIELATGDGPLQPPKLAEIRVPPGTIKPVSLPETLSARDQDLGTVGATVTSTNGVGVVAERTVWYAADRTGVTSVIGAREPGLSWLVPPAAASTPADALMLLNVSGRAATVSISLLRQDGAPLTPGSLQAVRVKPGARIRVLLRDLTGGRPMVVVAASDVPIVAERVASSGNGDVAGVMGDVTRTEP